MKAALVVLVSVVLVCFRIRAASQATPSQGGESCLLGRPVCRVLADLTDQVELVTREVERRTTYIGRLTDQVELVTREVERRTTYIGRLADLEERLAVHEKRHLTTTVPGEGGLKEAHLEIRQLKERLDSQESLYKNLLKAVEEIKKNEIHPFVSNTEDDMLGNSNSDDGLSLLLTKVERVENITSEVQEELESEIRVRRHLEEDLNATRHDVRMLNDKFEMVAIVNRTLFEDRNETRESDEDEVRSLHFEEELKYLRAILTEMREKSTDAMTLSASRANDLEERVTELTNASKWMDATMRRDMQNIQMQIDALAKVQLDERLTQSEIRNLTFEVLDQRVALISENLAIAEHRVDSLETAIRHKLKDIDSKLRNATHFWNGTHFWNDTLSEMAEHVTKRLEGAVEDASSYGGVCRLPVDHGPCKQAQARWFYDAQTQSCLPFVFGGCGGNANRFKTSEICLQFCTGIKAAGNRDRSPPAPEVAPTPTASSVGGCAPSNCADIQCPYGIEESFDPNGCSSCRCSNPCEVHSCPDGSRCAIDVVRTSRESIRSEPVCRRIVKPGSCPSQVSPSDCESRCRDDADCRGEHKCCSNGCAFHCVPPEDDYLVPATQPEPARILPGPNVTEGKLGEPAELPCNAIGWPKPTVTWWRETTMLPLASQRYEQLPNYALLIRSVVHEDAGGYSCHAHNGIGSGSIFKVTLIIDIQAPPYGVEDSDFSARDSEPAFQPLPPPQPFPNAPTLSTHISLATSSPTAGAPLQVDCNVTGPPTSEVSVTWRRGGEVLLEDERRRMLSNHTLLIAKAEVEDGGMYECVAQHGGSVASSAVAVEVKPAPEDTSCVDNPQFSNCELIVQTRYCNNKFYGKYCCASCTKAGQLQSSAPQE